MPTDLDLDALAVAVEGMTPGPYLAHSHLVDGLDGAVADCANGDGVTGDTHLDAWAGRDAHGIAALLNAAPALIAQARDAARLARRVEALERVLAEACDLIDSGAAFCSDCDRGTDAEHLRSLLTPTKEADRGAE